ncbi:MAG: chromosomal replication initiator protein DnaA [Clostridia bacterium]|nr:chromosomal replication initiator protein DnaA [Clostridia bacterium]
METINEAWAKVLDYLQKTAQFSQTAFDVWLNQIEPAAIENGKMVCLVQTEFQKNTIEQHYSPKIIAAFEQVLGIPLGLTIYARESLPRDEESAKLSETSSDFESNFKFENFIIGPSNRFAYVAAQAVAGHPAGQYNPLFIHGGTGLGKTHLMYAICNEIRRKNPHFNILYIKGQTMINEIIEKIRSGDGEELRQKYHAVDVLLVDDIQFLSGKESTQAEFFHMFDYLHSNNKQIVLTSDRPPKEIAYLDDRLRSRFEMGLTADIQPPDIETRIAIVQKKAESLGFEISNEVAEYIAGQIKTNVRQLEGVVKNLRAQYMLGGEKITLHLAQNAVRDIRTDNQPVSIKTDRIIEEVARSMQVTVEDIRSPKRSAPISLARQIAQYIIRTMTGLSMESIGEEFGARDHSTVVYALKKIEEKMKKDPAFNILVTDIIKNLSENP